MKCQMLSPVIALIAVATAAAKDDDNTRQDWPGWRGGYYSGVVDAPGLINENTALQTLWKRQLGSGYSAIAVAENKVVTMCSDNEYDYVVALSVDSGEELWRCQIAKTYPGHDGANDGPVSTPAVSDGRVYALGPRGDLLALDLRSGRHIWSTHLVREHDAVAPHWGFTSSPLIYRNLIILASGGTKDNAITAFDSQTGKRVWAYGSDAINYQSPLLFNPGDGAQVVCGGDAYLYGLDPQTGKPLWETPHGGSLFYRRIINPVVVGNDKLFMTYQRTQSKLVQVVKQANGYAIEDVWTSANLKRNYNIPVYHQGHIYGFSGTFLSCIDATTGDLVWKSRPPGDGFLILVDGHLVVMTKKGSLHLAKASPRGYEEVDQIQLFDKLTWTPPSFADGRIFARSSFDKIAAVAIVTRDRDASRQQVRSPRLTVPSSRFAAFVAKVENASNKAALLDEFIRQQTNFPLFEGDSLVHVIYRGPAKDLALRGDMFETYEEVPMQRLSGTDFFYASFRLDPEAHLIYQFIKNFDERVPDPRNPHKSRSIVLGGEVSEIFMPRCILPIHLKKPDGVARGTLATVEFESEKRTVGAKTWGGPRQLQIYLPPGYAESEARYPVLYIHYGDIVLEAGGMRNALDNVIGKTIQPIIAVFVPSISPYEYARSQREVYAQMVAEKLIPFIDARYRTIAKPQTRAILGGDEGGYSAYDIAFRYPGTFGHVAGQSVLPIADGDEQLLALIDHSTLPKMQLYLDWGEYDVRISERNANVARFGKRLSRFLVERGYRVLGGGTSHGSDVSSWGLRVDTILEAMFGMKQTESLK